MTQFLKMSPKNRTDTSKEDILTANKHKKICSTSVVIRQIKTKTRYNNKPIGVDKIKQINKQKHLVILNAVKNVKQQGLSFIDGGNAKWYSHYGKQFSSFL